MDEAPDWILWGGVIDVIVSGNKTKADEKSVSQKDWSYSALENHSIRHREDDDDIPAREICHTQPRKNNA